MKRYKQLLQLIDLFQPASIIETGVWNGQNSLKMIYQALQHQPHVTYTGYDLFENGSAELDAKEFNVKPHNTAENVRNEMLHVLGSLAERVTITLVTGDTNETLKPGTEADFVFIDGGHSIKTIWNDFEKLQESKIIVLDDYYIADRDGNCPDIRKYGCNELIEEFGFEASTFVLPAKDPVKGGGFTQFVLVMS